MRIAIIEHAESGDYAEYIYSLIEEKAKEHNYQIKTWSSSVPAFQQHLEDDAIIFIHIEKKSNWLLNWLYHVKIPSILRKTKMQAVIDLNGVGSSKIHIPQFIIAGEALLNKKLDTLNAIENYAAKNFAASLQTASGCFIYSDRSSVTDNINPAKTHFIPYTAPGFFRTYEWHDKLMIKANYSENKEFFLSVVGDNAVDDFVLLLQSFSKFKKWQESNMQLLVLPKHDYFDTAITEKVKTYKYRDDVKLIENTEDTQIATIFASAHSYLQMNVQRPDLQIIAIALQCSLPIISFDNSDVKEYAGDAALFCKDKNAAGFGNSIIKLYKDESLYSQLKQAAFDKSATFKRKEFADKLWQYFVVAAQQ
ncbi:MAG: glycosyltransferase [Bacteroidetes bacterium]|nr:glycosyltransferase [Bacteroidota bacterium]